MRRLSCIMLIVWLSACSAVTPAPAATPRPSPLDQFAEERERMVDDQIIPRDVTDPIVLQAMRRVPRHEFVPPEYLGQSYENHPLPIGYGQTISQPFIVAYMSDHCELKPGDRVLEIGTGSGYQAAILADMGLKVYSIEIIPELAAEADARLEAPRLRRAGARGRWVLWLAGSRAVRCDHRHRRARSCAAAIDRATESRAGGWSSRSGRWARFRPSGSSRSKRAIN